MKPAKAKTAFSISTFFATFLIISVCVAVFYKFGNTETGRQSIQELSLSPHNLFGKGDVKCLVTAGFVHKDIWHLAFNVIGILIFGGIVEKRFGAVKTLLIYFGALILSMFFSCAIYTFVMHRNVALIGASGALMGLIACAMLIDPFAVTYEMLLPIPVMVKGWMFFYVDMKGFLGGEVDGVSHLAHLLGFLSIAVIVYFLGREEKKTMLKGLAVNIISVALFLYVRARFF